MKQKLLLILSIMLLLITSARAQSFMFYRGDQPLDDNAEFTVTNYEVFMDLGDIIVLSLEPDLHLKNITDKDVQTTVTQTILDVPLDSVNGFGYLSFCFLDCTTGNLDRTKSGIIQANSFSIGYHVNFYAYEGVYNHIKVKYEAYLANDISKTDKKTVTVTYLYNENSVTQLNRPNFNPALTIFQEGNQVKFNYVFDSNNCKLEIYNLMGQKVAQHSLTSGNGTFTLPEKLTTGIYICVVKNEKQTIATQKFIVK